MVSGGFGMKQRIFVTGATGVIGRRSVEQMVNEGHSVTAVARSDAKADQLRKLGATPISIDLFDVAALTKAFAGHDAVVNLATNIPTGLSAVNPRAWRTNDRLRREASAAIAAAVAAAGVGRMVQESITFPYVANGSDWISEDHPRTYFSLNQSTVDAASATNSVVPGAAGVVLRFGMFMAPESPHMRMVLAVARRGFFAPMGSPDGYISFIHADDAAGAVVAALGVPSGTYNVAEAEPDTRALHRDTLAGVVGRKTLRQIPKLIVKAGGAATESFTRSHRISSELLQGVSSWRPSRRCVETWAEVSGAQK
jgi:nucleoside-diphosphate-sugar epimerase